MEYLIDSSENHVKHTTDCNLSNSFILIEFLSSMNKL
jgi:hypothetical protein